MSFKSLRGGSFCDRLTNFLMSLGHYLHLHVRCDFAMQLDGHGVFAQALERLASWILRRSTSKPLASSPPAISAEVTDPKSWPFSPDLRVKLSTMGSSLATSSSACSLFRGGAAGGGGLHLFNDGLVGQRGLQRQLAGQQKVAAVAVGHLDDIAAVAQIGYVFFQNYFHFKLSSVAGGIHCRPPLVLDTNARHGLHRAGFYIGLESDCRR